MKIKNNGKFEQPIKINTNLGVSSDGAVTRRFINNLDQNFWDNVEINVGNSSDSSYYAEDLNGFFNGASLMKKTPKLNNPNIVPVSNMSRFFQGCKSLEEVTNDYFFDGITDTSYMFKDCSSLRVTPKLNLNLVDNAVSMFENSGIVEVGQFKIGSSASTTPNLSRIFYNCSELTGSINLISKSTIDLHQSFENCSKLKNLIISGSNSTIKNLGIKGCSNLEILQTPYAIFNNLEGTLDLSGCSKLTTFVIGSSINLRYIYLNGLSSSVSVSSIIGKLVNRTKKDGVIVVDSGRLSSTDKTNLTNKGFTVTEV